MGKYCLYSDTPNNAPCIVIKTDKYSYLNDFLSGDKKHSKDYSIPVKIECLVNESGKPSAIKNKCINCMFCIFGCTGNKIILLSEIQPGEFCTDLTSVQRQELEDKLLSCLFQGKFIKLQSVPFSQIKVKYKTFDDFTSVDETGNIAVWAVNAMKYISRSLEPRISLEVGLKIQSMDRGGRLDISLLNTKEGYLFLAETKVTFDAMITENRYISQLLAYETEIQKICTQDLKRCKFLIIGGQESDLLPQQHSDCTSKVGNRAAGFYEDLRKNGFFFISANALLALGLMKMFVSSEKYNLENLHDIINCKKYLGLLSSGLICNNGDVVPY